MKQIISLIFFIIPIFIYSQITGQLNIDKNQLIFSKENGFDKVSYLHDYITKIGMPQLPVIYRSYVVPFEASDFELQIQSEEKETLPGNYLIIPVQPPRTSSVNDEVEFVNPDSIIYNSLTPFPNTQASIVSNEIIQGYRVVTIALYPLEYIPAQRTLAIRQYNYHINYGAGSSFTKNIPKISYRRASLAKTYVQSIVCNPELVETYTNYGNIIPETTNLNRSPDNPMLRTVNVIEQIVPDFVIITNNELKSAFQRLADWKTKKGIPTIIQTVEEIENKYHGSDLVEKIKNYLNEISNRWNGNCLSVLLGGDTEIVPTRLVRSNSRKITNLQCTDACYSSNNLEWIPKTNKSKEDCSISLCLGRIPIKNISQANSFINKILEYEKSSRFGIDYSYYNNFMITSAFMEKDVIPWDGYMSYFDDYRKKSLKPPANYWYLFDHFGCKKNDHNPKNQIYDTSQGQELSKANFISALENGTPIGRIHFIYHKDHSFTSSFGISTRDKGQQITNEEIDNMPNTPYYNIIMSGSCHPADFARDCIAEHFLNKRGGTIAFIGNSDVGWRDEYPLCDLAFQTLFKNPQTSIGQYDIGYVYLKSVGKQHRLHLLGDPTMPVWTATPQNLKVMVSPNQITNGPTTISVQVTNLPAGQQALICLRKGEEGYATLTVSDTKVHNFQFTPRTSGYLEVTVTAHNFRPFEKNISVSTNYDPSIHISSCAIFDGGSANSIGNEDDRIDAGETIEMILSLKNAGATMARNVQGILKCNSPRISLLKDTVRFGDIASQTTIHCLNRFRFKVDANTRQTLKNDFNAIRFYLDMTDANGTLYTDTINIDVFAPELALRTQVVNGTIFPKQECSLFVNLMNVGSSHIARLEARLFSEENSYIESCPVNNSRYWRLMRTQTGYNVPAFTFLTKSTYKTGYPLKMRLEVANEYGKTWTFHIDPADVGTKMNSYDVILRPYEKSIELAWSNINNPTGYNVYRSTDGADGTYAKLTPVPVTTPYYKDENLTPSTIYHYKLTAISKSGNESERSNPIQACTSLACIGAFPRFKSGSHENMGSITVGDVNNDGKKEIFNLTRLFENPMKGFLMGTDYTGADLFDIDGNPNTFSGFAELAGEAYAMPAIGDIYGNGEQNIIVATRNDAATPRNRLTCFASRDNNQDGLPDVLWENETGEHVYAGAVLSNMDNSSDGTLEILVKSDNQTSPLIIYNNDGEMTGLVGLGLSQDMDLSSPAVADLDNDGDKEIIAGYENGVYIWHHDGSFFAELPNFRNEDYIFSSSPVICDLDNDGEKEIIITAKNKNQTSDCIVFAIKLDGKLVPGWDGTQTFPFTWVDGFKRATNELSVGDLNHDDELEVCATGDGVLKVWNNRGELLISRKESGITGNKNAPILADVDGDSYVDIIYTCGASICAIDRNGNTIKGFPISTDDTFTRTPCVADIDGDGKNELVAADKSNIYVWKTKGNAQIIEWGSERHDSWNTGEYRKICEPRLILSNTTWNEGDPCGNVIVEKGTLTIPYGKNLSLTDKTSKIIIRKGGTLVVDGGKVSNANVLALPGGRVELKNGGTIQLRQKGKVAIKEGATFLNLYGSIKF